MAINVTCPGCLKRFEVSDRFAGQKGPCPNCNTIIDIPKETVKVHAPDDFSSGGKTVKGKAILKPIDRVETTSGIKLVVYTLLAMVGVFGLSFAIRLADLGRTVTSLIGAFGLFILAIPLSAVGYVILREGEEIDFLEGKDLYLRAAISGGVYAVLWIVFEGIARSMFSGAIWQWLLFVPFLVIGIVTAHAVFDLDFSKGLLHFLLFLLVMILMRWAIGLDWIWTMGMDNGPAGAPPESMPVDSAPPPPPTPTF
jgi:hypothetical protein